MKTHLETILKLLNAIRVRIVRSNRELEQLPANSTDIFERNLLDRYMQRHEQLELLCLAEFAAWFKFSKLNARSEQSNEEYDEPIDFDAYEENNVAAQSYQMLDGTGRVKRRNHGLILRWVRFSLSSVTNCFLWSARYEIRAASSVNCVFVPPN